MSETKGVVLDRAWIIEGRDGSAQVRKAADRPSQQLPEDPFSYAGGAEGGLIRPLYDLDSLLSTQESNSLHGRCVRQKAIDILGRGITLRAREVEDGADPSTEEEKRWHEFLQRVEDDERGDESFKERLTQAHEDFEGIGWAVIEVARDRAGLLTGLWYVPGHTVRAHADGKRFAQKRGGKTTWFKRFGVQGTVHAKSGAWDDREAGIDEAGNELIVIRNHTPRSSFYGAPDHIPALAAIAGWKAQAEFNLRFFDNVAVPSYAVVIEGATLTPDLEQLILDHFRQIKGDPSRTIVIPIPAAAGDESMQPKLRFERLSVETKEATHIKYRQDNALEVLIAHGMPPYRVGWPIVGSLGGDVAEEMTRIYNDSVVQTRQETWEQRLNRALLGPKGLDIHDWELKCAELDVRNEVSDLKKARDLYELGVVTPNDNAKFFGYDPRPEGVPGGDDYIAVPLAPGGRSSAAPAMPVMDEEIAKAWRAEVVELAAIRKRIEAIAGVAA